MIYNISFANLVCRFNISDKRYLNEFKQYYKRSSTRSAADLIINIKPNPSSIYTSFKIISDKEGLYHTFPQKKIDFRDINFFLKGFIHFFVLNKNVYIFHGSTFFIGNNAYVFLGPSGAGKSTVVGFMNRNHVLGDDAVIIKKQGRDYFVHSSPFDNKKLPNMASKKVKLKAIFLIKKSQKTKLFRISNISAKNKVIFNNFLHLFCQKIAMADPFFIPKNIYSKLLHFNNQLFKKVPLYYLYFQKNDEFIRLVKNVD